MELDSQVHFAQFTYGSAPQKIACGIHHSASSYISHVLSDIKCLALALRGICVSNLASSNSFLADGTVPFVWAWGRNVYNVAGFGDEVKHASTPSKVDSSELMKGAGIYEVACGHSHSLFLRKNQYSPGGDVVGCGMGNRGRQGYPNPHADADDTPEVEDIWSAGCRFIPIGFSTLNRAGSMHGRCGDACCAHRVRRGPQPGARPSWGPLCAKRHSRGHAHLPRRGA